MFESRGLLVRGIAKGDLRQTKSPRFQSRQSHEGYRMLIKTETTGKSRG